MENNFLFFEENSQPSSIQNQEQLKINPIPIEEIEKITPRKNNHQPKCHATSSIELNHLGLNIDDEESFEDMEELQMLDLFAISKSQVIKDLNSPRAESKLGIGKSKTPSTFKLMRKGTHCASKKSLFSLAGAATLRRAETMKPRANVPKI
jgi:hypothetical protein